MISLLAILCLPVDVFIFWQEPFGAFGTMVVMVLAFIPFQITMVDAAFPEKQQYVRTLGGKITKINKVNNTFDIHNSKLFMSFLFMITMGFCAYEMAKKIYTDLVIFFIPPR